MTVDNITAYELLRLEALGPFEVFSNDGEQWMVSTLSIPQHPIALTGASKDNALTIKYLLNNLPLIRAALHAYGEGEKMRECARHLALVLPMAKGFAHQNPVGSNQAIVNDAAEALATLALTTEPNNG